MITARPLRVKGLQSTPVMPAHTIQKPDSNRFPTESKPDSNRSNISRTTEKILNSKTRVKLILLIVRDSPAITATGVKDLLREFCKTQKFTELNPQPDYSMQLLNLVKQNKLTRIKLLGKWRYFKRYD